MRLRIGLVFLAALACAASIQAQQSFGDAPAPYPQAAPQGGQMGYPGGQPQAGYPMGQGGGAMPPGYPQGQAGYPPPPQGGGYPMPPQGQGYPMPPQGGQMGQQAPMPGPDMAGGMNQMQMLLQAEMQDYGVAPQSKLQKNLHGPTPTSIPGGQLITTDRLLSLYQQGQGALLVFDVLGSGQTLPMAQNALGAAEAGSFKDQTQKQFGEYLQQVTQGDKNRPMVFYCQGTQCWMSYNAALRAINLGYTQVYWYRGGVEAWYQMQHLAMAMAMAMQPQMQQQPMQQQMPAMGGNPAIGSYPPGR